MVVTTVARGASVASGRERWLEISLITCWGLGSRAGVVDVVVVCGAIPEVCEKHPAKEKVTCAVYNISIQASPAQILPSNLPTTY